MSTFHMWRRRLGLTGVGGSGDASARVDHTAIGVGMFREVRVAPDEVGEVGEGAREAASPSSFSGASGVEIVVSCPLRLRLSAGFDEAVARRALRLAREAGGC